MRWLVLAIFALLPAAAQERWNLQYFYDQDESAFRILDLQFFSPARGIAVGVLQEKNGKAKGYSVVTADGGAHWSPIPLKEVGSSLFLLDDAHAWLVTDSGLWFSAENGRDWKKVSKQKGIQRVHFLTAERGFAIGYPKLFLKTEDGGKTWQKQDIDEKSPTKPEYTAYNWISFADDKLGIVTGRSTPPRKRNSEVPIWMDPEASTRSEWPAVTVLIQTLDSGKTWNSQAASIFGKITRVRTSKTRTVALLEYEDYFAYPSELMRLDGPANGIRRIYRDKTRLITDIALLPDESAIAVGLEPPGSVSHSPIPGRVKVLRSANLSEWKEMSVDYRAAATRVLIAALDRQNCWIATDTGMILHLEPGPPAKKQ